MMAAVNPTIFANITSVVRKQAAVRQKCGGHKTMPSVGHFQQTSGCLISAYHPFSINMWIYVQWGTRRQRRTFSTVIYATSRRCCVHLVCQLAKEFNP